MSDDPSLDEQMNMLIEATIEMYAFNGFFLGTPLQRVTRDLVRMRGGPNLVRLKEVEKAEEKERKRREPK